MTGRFCVRAAAAAAENLDFPNFLISSRRFQNNFVGEMSGTRKYAPSAASNSVKQPKFLRGEHVKLLFSTLEANA